MRQCSALWHKRLHGMSQRCTSDGGASLNVWFLTEAVSGQLHALLWFAFLQCLGVLAELSPC